MLALALLAGALSPLRPARAQAPAPTTTATPVATQARPPAPPSAPAPRQVTALVFDDGDVRKSTLIGPSGQLYEPAPAAIAPGTPGTPGTPGAPAPSAARWVRRLAGGVSSTVSGAARADGELIVSGAQTPVFRQREGQWMLAQLGQRGRVLYSAGPFFALAIGKQVFVAGKPPPPAKGAIPSVDPAPTLRVSRVGAAPGNVVALWAASEASIYVVTDEGVFRRRGSAFVPALKLPGVVGLSGAAPHALTADTAINLRTGAKTRLAGPLLRVARSDSTPAALLRAPAGGIVLARDVTNAARNVELPPPPAAQLAPPAPLASPAPPAPPASPTAGRPPPPAIPALPSLQALAAVDAAGRAVVASPSVLLVYDGAAWSAGLLLEDLPAPRAGPAPARSR